MYTYILILSELHSYFSEHVENSSFGQHNYPNMDVSTNPLTQIQVEVLSDEYKYEYFVLAS